MVKFGLLCLITQRYRHKNQMTDEVQKNYWVCQHSTIWWMNWAHRRNISSQIWVWMGGGFGIAVTTSLLNVPPVSMQVPKVIIKILLAWNFFQRKLWYKNYLWLSLIIIIGQYEKIFSGINVISKLTRQIKCIKLSIL